MNENVRTFGPENCVVCGLSFKDSVEEKVTVRAKGLATLIHYSFLHKDGDLMNYLESEPEKVVVHIRCRNKYTKPRTDVDRACDDSVQNPAKRLRSSTEVFSFKTDCFQTESDRQLLPRWMTNALQMLCLKNVIK